MLDRLQILTPQDKDRLHGAAMSVLGRTGIVFHNQRALEIFKQHGIRVEGGRVHPTEDQVMKAAASAPPWFTIEARNPERNISVGRGDSPIGSGYGAPFVAGPDGTQRPATLDDYISFSKLAHSSRQVDFSNFMVVEPGDLPPETAHLDMLLNTMLLTDKPFMSCPLSRQSFADNVAMANILFGGEGAIRNRPVMFPTINALSPLQVAEEMADAIIDHAAWGQPVTMSNIVQGGATGPVRLAGLLAVQIAEILSGLVLTQLVNPGNPFVCGTGSCPTDMRTGGMAVGSPEAVQIRAITAQMSAYYDIPVRVGGSVTNSHFPDIRAGIESSLLLYTALASGSYLVVHSCGVLSCYLSMSYEKYLIDEELCGMIRKILRPVDFSPGAFDLESIHQVGPGGQHFTRPETFRHCRTEYHIPEFLHRQSYGDWRSGGGLRADEIAGREVRRRLEEYVRPDVDPGVERDLKRFVSQRKGD